MKKKQTSGMLLIWLCCAVYFVSYLARLNFSASTAEIVRLGVLSKTEAGLVGTALFVTYGVGQLVSGILGDRLRPNRLILAGLAVTAICNVLIPFCRALVFFLMVWGINGFAQAMLWPPIVKLLSGHLSEEKYSRACVWVSAASQLATVAIYLAVPACILLWDWRSAFWFSTVLAAGIGVIWLFGFRKFERKKKGEEAAPVNVDSDAKTSDSSVREAKIESSISYKKLLVGSGLVTILLAIAFQGVLRDGITTWMPTYLSEGFGLSAATSIFLNVLLPLFSVGAVWLAGVLYRRVFKDELKEGIFFFGMALVFCLLLSCFGNRSAVLSLVLAALVTGCMHAINLMLISYVPKRFERFGKASTVSGITNAFTYVGSAASSYGFAAIAGSMGWSVLIWIWAGVCVLGIMGLLIAAGKWKRFFNKFGDKRK